ncbi:MAG TPA: AIR synthase-related protein, partial [Acidimicrobiales bacterium]|nr:AIR synthase-related protein [Acidimicrobiales bacterium]
GLLGVVEHLNAPPPGWAWRAGDAIVLVGSHVAPGENSFPLGGSRWATRRERRGGRLAHFDPASFREVVDFVVAEVARVVAGETSDLSAVHDVAGGGLGVALAEMAATSGVGLRVEGIESHQELFSEFVGRFVVATSDVSALLQRAYDHGVAAKVLGHCGGDDFVVEDLVNLPLSVMRERRSGALESRLHEGV